MDKPDDEQRRQLRWDLKFAIRYGLAHKTFLLKRQFTRENDAAIDRAAEKIVDYLCMTNWRFERGTENVQFNPIGSSSDGKADRDGER